MCLESSLPRKKPAGGRTLPNTGVFFIMIKVMINFMIKVMIMIEVMIKVMIMIRGRPGLGPGPSLIMIMTLIMTLFVTLIMMNNTPVLGRCAASGGFCHDKRHLQK